MDNIPAILSNMSSYGWDNNKYNLYSYTFVKNIGATVW